MQDHTQLYNRMDKDVRAALWQWLIDHANVSQKSASYFINLNISSEDEMWKRVYYRYTGQYERYNREEKEARRKFSTFMHIKTEHDTWVEKFSKVDKSRKLLDRLAIFFYKKTRDYIKK